MRIGIMCHSGFGGSVQIALELAGELARRRHRVHLFTRTTPLGGAWRPPRGVALHRSAPDSEADLHPAQLYLDWPPGEFQGFLSTLIKTVAQEGLEVLHFHYAVPFAFLAAEVKRRLGEAAPVLMGTLHGTDVSAFGQNPLKGTRLAQALMGLDHLTTVSKSNARLAKAIFRLPALPQVIPNFVDLSRFRPPNSPREPEDASPEGCCVLSRPKIVHISNFRKVKTLPSVARIFLGIRQRLEAEFWVVGDGEMRDELVSLFRGSEFDKDLRFFGLRADVAPILAQTQLLLMHSESESFCLAALEAMACGVPVLASRVGGLPEVVVHGQTGFLVPFGDHQTAVDLAVALLSDPAGHRAMREAALRRARRFGRDRIVSSYENLYQRLLSSQGTAFKSACGQGIGRLGRTR